MCMRHKPTFLNQNKPLVTCMILTGSAETAIQDIRNAIYDGADAIGFEMEFLNRDEQNPETLRQIFDAASRHPVYVTNYRDRCNTGKTDDELADGLLMELDAGATLLDVMGDLFGRTEGELSLDPAVIEKQKAFIEKVHQKGGEVVMSSHVKHYLPAEEVLKIAFEHQARGADICKIVTGANSEEEEMENLRISMLLKQQLDIPFLFLSVGTHTKLHRTIGPALGSCMWLTVLKHDGVSNKAQPVCRAMRAVADNFDF